MTLQIIFIFPRDPKVVENWPEEPNPMFNSIKDAFEIYQKACEQAIANAIEFKLQPDKEQVRLKLEIIHGVDMNWQPEINKPYAVPEGIIIEFKKDRCAERCLCSEFEIPDCTSAKQFAFIKSSQVVNGPEPESQDQLWDEILTMISHEGVIKTKSQFTISRNKA